MGIEPVTQSSFGDSLLKFLEETMHELKPEGWIRVCHVTKGADGREVREQVRKT